MSLPLYMRQGLPWYRRRADYPAGPQQECIESAARLGHSMHLKWGDYLYSHVQAYDDARYLIDPAHVARLAPAGERMIHPPMFLLIVSPTSPCQFCLDIEWYMDGQQLSDDDAKSRVQSIIALVQTFNETYHDHRCVLRAFVSSCSRDTNAPYDDEAGSGGYKYSYHVLLRCAERCYFHSFDHWKQYADQFIGYLRTVVRASDDLPWLFFGRNRGKCAVDVGIYTRWRAMRMIGCAKKPGGKPMLLDPLPPTDPHSVSAESHEDIRLHLHGYVETGGMPWLLCANQQLLAPTAVRTPRPNAINAGPRVVPLPEPEQDLLREYIQHVLEGIERRDVRYVPQSMTLVGTEHQASTIMRLLGPPLSPAARVAFRPYESHWFRLCCICVRYMSVDDGRALWMRLAAEINKPEENPAYQYERARAWISQGRIADSYVERFDRDMQFLATTLGLDTWELPDDTPGHPRYACLAADEVEHPWVDARVERMAYQRQGAIVFVCRCGRERFVGYIPEHGSIISNQRYIGDSDLLVAAFDRAVASADNPNTAKIDMVIIGQMGTGKTEILKRMGRNRRARMIGFVMRQALGYDMHSRLSGSIDNLRHYVLNKVDLAEHSRLIIQLESIWRLTRNGKVNEYDIVFVDELESLLLHFSSETLDCNRQQVFDIFVYIVSSCRVFISCDADTGPATLEFLASVRGGRRMIYRNLSTPLHRHHTIYGNELDWYNKLLQALLLGLNIVVVCNSKRRLDGIRIRVEQLGISCKFYTSRTSNADKIAVSNCTVEWARYRVVGFTGVISAGVNCMADWFDQCFVLVVPESAPPQQVHQMIGRVRILRMREVHTLIMSSIVPANIEQLTTLDGCVEHLLRRDELVVRNAAALAARCQLDFDEGTYRIDMGSVLNRVLARNFATTMQARHNYLYWYRFYAKLHGDSCTYLSKEDAAIERDQIGRNDVLGDVAEASLSDSQQLSQTERVPCDIQDPLVSPEQAMKEHWCAFLLVDDITCPFVWDILKSSNTALPALVTLVVALYPHREVAARAVMSAVVSANRPPIYDDPHLAELLSFVARLKLFSATRLCYKDYAERGVVVGELLELMGGIGVGQLPMVHTVMNTWLPHCTYRDRLPVLCPSRVNWTKPLSNVRSATAACDAILRLANIKAVHAGGGTVSIDDASLVVMLNLVAVCCPSLYAHLVPRPSQHFPTLFP